MLLLIVLSYTVIVLVDTIPTYRSKKRLDFWVSTILLAISFIIAVLFSFGIFPPSPAGFLEDLTRKIYGI